MFDVIVIGGGPAGSYTACRLVRMGFKVLVVEKKERVGEKICCTGIVGCDCIESFPVSASVILRRANSARLFSPSGRLVRVWRPEPQAYILDRSAFDRHLADKARGSGAEYLLGAVAESVSVNADSITVDVTSSGKASRFTAKAVVLATGFGSPLVRRLDFGKVGDFVMGAQTEVEVRGVDEVEVYFGWQVAPGFFGWLVPTQAGRALVGVMSRRQPGLFLRKLLSSLVAEGKVSSGEAEIYFGGIPLKPLAKTFGVRMLVVGDAAGQVKPTSGGGIYYGLLCAEIAADTLRRGLECGNLTAKALSVYQKQWRKRLGRELTIDYYTRRLYERLGDGQIDRLFHFIDSSGIVEALGRSEELSFDWHGRVVLRMLRLLPSRLVKKGLGRVKPLSALF